MASTLALVRSSFPHFLLYVIVEEYLFEIIDPQQLPGVDGGILKELTDEIIINQALG